jgi:molybdate transport system ATP-binding protein
MSLRLREVALQLAHYRLEVTLDFDGGTTALYGPSGSGKTSILELIAGLRTPERGAIELNGSVVFDAATGVTVPPRLRRVGYVPQDDALFPHLNARQNIEYGLRGGANAAILETLELTHLLRRPVTSLSGGERKRVALARALMTRPEVLLLDEPLAGVDIALRDRVLDYLLRIRSEVPTPTIYVTHQMEEVNAICDAIVVLEAGQVIEHRALHL